jgi:DNA polymerase I
MPKQTSLFDTPSASGDGAEAAAKDKKKTAKKQPISQAEDISAEATPTLPLTNSPASIQPNNGNPDNGNKVIIIDGHALAYRSYFAFQNLSTSKGVPTNAVYGFLRLLQRILKEEGDNDATIVTFDAPAKSFRHEQYEGYKAGRAAAPDDLHPQIETIKKLIRYMGIFQIEQAGLEADDLIGTIAKRLEEQGYSVEIVTSDRDAYQLVSDRICVRGLDKTDRYGPKEILEKYGVTVEQWTDYRALIGDASDNIPGAKGIGPVTAQKLLQKYGSLEYILNNLDTVEPKVQAKKIQESIEDVKFSKQLSAIVTDAPIDVTPQTWAVREMDKDNLKALLTELEFTSVLRELNLAEAPTYDYKNAPWGSSFYVGAVGYVFSDVNPMLADITDLAVATTDSVATVKDEEEKKDFFSNAKELHACDAKALTVYARNQDYNVTPGDDPLLMAYVLDPNSATPETVARKYDVGEWGKTAGSRAIITAELLKKLPTLLTGKQKDLYEQIEKPLQSVLADMEQKGITIDSELLHQQSKTLEAQLNALEDNVRTIAETDKINLNSRDQVADLLFKKLNLQAGKKTTTGKQSTSVQALEPLRDTHPIVAMILDYRELSKLKGTYLDPLPKLVNEKTKRLHTTFNQVTVATGRLSSVNPNLQNIPIRTEVGREIRKAFVAAEGNKLLVADYSQIELRILAHVTSEPALIESFNKGEDIHARTASNIYKVDIKSVNSTMRRVAKIINFGVLYGMSAHRLTRELGIEYAEADTYIKTYFAGYPNVQKYIDDTLEFCRKNGYVETLLGRRRLIPDINVRDRNLREYAERTAYNMPIQGTAADIMKIAMIELSPKLKEHDACLLLQVHDEIIVEAPKDRANTVAEIVHETMENAYKLSVPLLAEVGIGNNWLEAK